MVFDSIVEGIPAIRGKVPGGSLGFPVVQGRGGFAAQDLTTIDFSDILPNTAVMAITVRTAGDPQLVSCIGWHGVEDWLMPYELGVGTPILVRLVCRKSLVG